MSRTESIIDGFEFINEEEAMRAAKETEGVKFIRQKTNLENPYMVLQIYNKMVSQNMFGTAVGYAFLKELQNYLYDSPVIADDEIRPIHVEPVIAREEMRNNPETKASTETQETETQETEKSRKDVTEKTRELRKMVRVYKQRSFVLSFVSVILAVSVIVMCIIAATGGSMTILNYENKLIDKYEAWEQELEEREAAVKERERQFGQN